MNVQWRKLGSLALTAGAALALCFSVTATRAQTIDRSADGWHDPAATSDQSDARPIQPANDQLSHSIDDSPSRPIESPRAGSPSNSPTYQQYPQTNSSRRTNTGSDGDQPFHPSTGMTPRNQIDNQNNQPYDRPRGNQNYGQYSGANNGQYNGPNGQQYRRPTNQAQYYSRSQSGSNAGPNSGYPPDRARMVAYRQQDVAFADGQPHVAPPPGQGQPSVTVEGPMVGNGPMVSGPMPGGPPMEMDGQMDGGCGCADGSCNGGCADGSCDGGCDFGGGWGRNASRSFNNWCRQDMFRDLSVYAGVQGFKDPEDLGENGDFGFHEGVNWGLPLWGCSGVGFQAGGEIDHSDLSPNATVFGDHRTQYFITTGVFYRPTRECGWQGGVVWDYMDETFYDDLSVSQIRANLSYVVDWSEFGFEATVATHDDKVPAPSNTIAALPTIDYSPVDLYTLYYGRRLCNGGQVKAYGGVANGLGAIVGANLDIAISDSFSLEGDFAYVIANKVPAGDIPGESANIAFSLVWHPGCHARDTFDSAYRPLFNVADNSSLIVNRR